MTEAKQPMADLDPALVERAAIAAVGGREVWMCLSENKRSLSREGARAALLSLGIPAAALNALAKGEAVVVPKEPTRDMIEAHQFECAGDADEAGPARIRSAYAAMLAASPYRSEP